MCWQLKRVCYDCGAISGRGSLLYGAAQLGLARRPVQAFTATSHFGFASPAAYLGCGFVCVALQLPKLQRRPARACPYPPGSPSYASIFPKGPTYNFFPLTPLDCSAYPPIAQNRGRMRFRLAFFKCSNGMASSSSLHIECPVRRFNYMFNSFRTCLVVWFTP